MEQRSIEWFDARKGYITASKIKPGLMSCKKSKTYQEYQAECLIYRAGGEILVELENAPGSGPMSKDLARGIALEPIARDHYQWMEGVKVQECGFIKHSTLPYCGATPDGLVGDKGLLEIKCRNTGYHSHFIVTDIIPPEYYWQMQFQLMCTGRVWVDYVSFDPNLAFMNAEMDIKRVYRDEKVIEEITQRVHEFNQEIIDNRDVILRRFGVGSNR